MAPLNNQATHSEILNRRLEELERLRRATYGYEDEARMVTRLECVQIEEDGTETVLGVREEDEQSAT